MARVSVVIPNYNHARFLERRIRSVLDQTFRDIEVILLDDASTDGSGEVLDEHTRDARVRLLRNRENSGSAFRQWNKGVREAEGEYVWIAESDDYADEHFLEALVPVLDAHPNVGLAYADSWLTDADGNVTGSYFEQASVRDWIDTTRWRRNFLASGREELAEFLSVLNTIPSASAVLFRRAAYERAGGADESFVMAGDWVLWGKILLQADVAFVAQRFNFWRQHSDTVRSRLYRSGLDVEEAFRATVFFQRQLHLPPGALTTPRRKLESFWFWRWWELFPAIPVRRSLRIYRMAREIDPYLLRRFLRVSARRLRQRLGNVRRLER